MVVLNDYPKNRIQYFSMRPYWKKKRLNKYINKREGINFLYRTIPSNKCRRNERNAISPWEHDS